MGLDRHSVVGQGDGFIEADVDGEIVALNVDKGTCYGLNKVGARVWRLIAQPQRIGDLCAVLTGEYEVDAQTCEEQVLALLEQLRAEGMVILRKRSAAE